MTQKHLSWIIFLFERNWKSPKTIKECEGQFIGLIKISKNGWSIINKNIEMIKERVKKLTLQLLNFLILKK